MKNAGWRKVLLVPVGLAILLSTSGCGDSGASQLKDLKPPTQEETKQLDSAYGRFNKSQNRQK